MFRERRFFSNIRATMIVGIALGVLLLALLLQMEISADWLPLKSAGIGLSTATILASLLLIPARHIWTTDAGPAGVYSYDSFGIRSEVPWEQMTGVDRKLGYLWVERGQGKMHVTIPTWIEDNEGFAWYVVTHAAEGNPLRAHFERSGTVPFSGYPR